MELIKKYFEAGGVLFLNYIYAVPKIHRLKVMKSMTTHKWAARKILIAPFGNGRYSNDIATSINRNTNLN